LAKDYKRIKPANPSKYASDGDVQKIVKISDRFCYLKWLTLLALPAFQPAGYIKIIKKYQTKT
jgi:hypothetical protein